MRLQLVVLLLNNEYHYHPVGPDRPWRIDRPSGSIVIGKGLPRTYIPLDNVASFSIEEVAPCRHRSADDATRESDGHVGFADGVYVKVVPSRASGETPRANT